jgi:serine phosphatase RsbU (regulator of sigma subunit)
MDIGLCSINKNTNSLKFSGANRPIWIIRKGIHKVEEIKGTKKAIGGSINISIPHFENHEVELKKGDCIYLFSDGYVDQFGGAEGKKIMTKKFKEILLEIQHKTMLEQEHYINYFIENWKKSIEQVDDVLVIGVRI